MKVLGIRRHPRISKSAKALIIPYENNSFGSKWNPDDDYMKSRLLAEGWLAIPPGPRARENPPPSPRLGAPILEPSDEEGGGFSRRSPVCAARNNIYLVLLKCKLYSENCKLLRIFKTSELLLFLRKLSKFMANFNSSNLSNLSNLNKSN